MHFLLKLLLSLLAGLGLSFTQAPHDLWPLIFPCFSLFYYLYVSAKNKKQVFAFSFVFALGYFYNGLYWIGNAFLIEDSPYARARPLATMALPILLSSLTALYLTISHILFKNNSLIKFMGFCLFLSLSEWVRGYAFTGLPWNLHGYGIAPNAAISQSLSLVGPYGLTFLAILWGSFFGFWATKPAYKTAIPFSILIIFSFAASYIYGHQRLQNAILEYDENTQVHIVQPNISVRDKWDNTKFFQNFLLYVDLLKTPLDADKKHIILWSETAIPFALLGEAAVEERIQNMVGENALLLSGALMEQFGEKEWGSHNALFAWKGNESGKQVYSKRHLVPFGEYIPLQEYIPLPTVTNFSGFIRGTNAEAIEIDGYPSFSVAICYEVIFANKLVSNQGVRPDYILTITNDAWYGDSAGPYQHFAQTRFRAIENGLPALRSANTGISGVIDPYGRVIEKTTLLTHGSIDVNLPKGLPSPTLYAQYKDNIFLTFLSICLFFICFLECFCFRNIKTKR